MALFKEVRDTVLKLLRVRTYTELQALEEQLKDLGIDLSEDFIWTEERRRALDSAELRVKNGEGPTVIFTGWYGSGKTTVLAELLRRFGSSELQYAKKLHIDPIEIRLNEDNTATDFLLAVFDGVTGLMSQDLALKTFDKNRALRDLPNAQPGTTRELVELLVSLDVSEMGKVKKFLLDLFREYKEVNKSERIVGLIIDELENITQTERESEPKLTKLLEGLFESSVRELVDRPESLIDPDVFIVFDIISKKELEEGGWLRPDVLERSDAWTFDINLTRASANSLMTHLLRLYLEAVVMKLGSGSSDERVREWAAALNQNKDPEDEYFTYPVSRSVHRAFSHALLHTVPATGAVMSFRAYQEGIRILLSEWSGSSEVDLSFMLNHADDLRNYYGEKYSGIDLDRLLDRFAVQAHVRKAASGVRSGQRDVLGNLVIAALLKSTSSQVFVSHEDLNPLLDQEIRPSEAVVQQVLRQVDQHQFEEWDVVGDSLRVDTALVVQRVTEEISEAERDYLQEAIEATTERREQTLEKISQASLSARNRYDSHIDDGILVAKPRQTPLLDAYYFSFTGQSVREMVEKNPALAIGLQIAPKLHYAEHELPVSIDLVLPATLKKFEANIQVRVTQGLETRWNVSRLLVDKFMDSLGLSPADALIETIKLSLLTAAGDVPLDLQERLAVYDRDFVGWFLADIQLTDAVRNTWIATSFGFREFHGPDETARLIRVLAWAPSRDLAYKSRETVHDSVGVVRGELGTPAQWSTELKKWAASEDFIEGGQLKPFAEWPKPLRTRIEEIDDLLAGSQLGFFVIGEQLLGGASMHKVAGAQAILHLLLRLGAREKDWLVHDESGQYKDVRLSTRSQTLNQARQKVASRIGDRLELVLVRELLLGEEGYPVARKLLQLRNELSAAASLEDTEAIANKVLDVVAPSAPEFQVPEQLKYLGEPWQKVESYLDFLVSISPLEPAGRVIHGLLEKYQEAVDAEVHLMLLLKKRNALAKALGEDIKPIPHTMLLRDLREQEGGTQKESVKDLKSKLETKSHLISDETAEGYRQVLDWSRVRAYQAVPEGLSSSVTPQDIKEAEAEIASLEKRIQDEAERLLGRVPSGGGIRAMLEEAESESERKSLAKLAARMEDGLGLVRSLTQRVSPPGAGALNDLASAVDEWEALANERLARRKKEIDQWLSERGLSQIEDEVMAELETARLPLTDIYARLEDDGFDVFADLLADGGKAGRRLAVLLAAAGLVRTLRAHEEGS